MGGVRDIFHGVAQGIDTFDCVHPTRLARHGGALVKTHYWQEAEFKGAEHINLRNSRFKEDDRPIDESCGCQSCKTYSRAYLHHLLKSGEILAINAITTHNVRYMNDLLKAIRAAISEDRLEEEKKNWLPDILPKKRTA